MKKPLITAPAGTRDMVYTECGARRELQIRLVGLFESRGYDEIITPVLEYYDLFPLSGNPVTQEELIKFSGPDGRIWALRPDMTTSIARAAATRLAGYTLPLRFYYVQDVFQSSPLLRGPQTTQAGVELLGAAGIRADVEVIAVALESLGKISAQFRLEIGHAGFYRALASSLGTDEEYNEDMRTLIESKNFASLKDFLEPYRDRPAFGALCRLPQLFGGEEVLDEAMRLTDGQVAAAQIEYLRDIYAELVRAGFENVMIDLGLLHHIDYYTGVVFRGYVEGSGHTVLRGGRYDGLCGLLGRELPATGFAVDLDEINFDARAAHQARRGIIHVSGGGLRRALELMDENPGAYELSPHSALSESEDMAAAYGVELVVAGGDRQ